MASAIYTVPRYLQQTALNQKAEPNKTEVTFMPTWVDLRTPVRKVMKVLQWRRQLTDLLRNFVSGAVALR